MGIVERGLSLKTSNPEWGAGTHEQGLAHNAVQVEPTLLYSKMWHVGEYTFFDFFDELKGRKCMQTRVRAACGIRPTAGFTYRPAAWDQKVRSALLLIL